MVLTPRQHASFHRIREALANFARTEGATGGDWLSPSLVDRFVAANPAGLAASELELAGRWRDAAPGPFFVMRHTPSCSIFMSTLGTFAVRGGECELAQLVPDTPTLVEVTLVPFDGLIVCVDNPRFTLSELGRANRADIDATYRSLADKGVIYSAAVMTRVVRATRTTKVPTTSERVPQQVAGAPRGAAGNLEAAIRELELVPAVPTDVPQLFPPHTRISASADDTAQLIRFRPRQAAAATLAR